MTTTTTEAKRVNIWALLIIFVTIVVLGVTVYFVHGFQIQRNAKGLLDQAHQFKEAGKDKMALSSMKQYLGLMPEDTKALAKYGSWLAESAENSRDMAKAYLLLKHAIRRDEDTPELRRKAAKLALDLGQFADAKAFLEGLQQENEDDAELVTMMARVEVGSREFAKAAEFYAQSLELDPEQVEVHEEYSYLLRLALDNPKSANEQIEKMLETFPDSVEARLAAARYYREFKYRDEAKKQIDYALNDLKSNDVDVLLIAGELAVVRGEMDEGERYFKKGLALYPEDLKVLQAMATLELQQGNKDKSADYLKECLNDLPEEPRQLYFLGNLCVETEKLDYADVVVQKFQQLKLRPFAGYLTARIAAAEKDWSEAAVALEQIRSHKMLNYSSARMVKLREQINVLLGDCYRALGNPDQRLKAYQRALASTPNWVPAQKGLASTLVSLNKLDQAAGVYRQLVKQAPGEGIQLARLLTVLKKWDEAEKVLAALPDEVRQSLPVRIMSAAILVGQGKANEAQRSVEYLRDQDPKKITPWIFLINLAQQQNELDRALYLIEQAEQKASPSGAWTMLRIGNSLRKGPGVAKKLLPKFEQDLDRYSGPDKDQLLLGFAGAYYRLKEFDEAKKFWEQVAERQPDNISLRFKLFEMAFQTSNEQEMQHWLEEIKSLEGGVGPYSAYGQAATFFLRSKGTNRNLLGQAYEKIKLAEEFRPSWSRLAWLKGTVYDVQNEKELALQHYQKAMTLGDRRVGVYKRALELMQDQGLYVEANELLKEIPDQLKSSDAFYRLFVEVTVLNPDETNSHAQALKVAEQAADKSDDYKHYLWLGQISAITKNPEKAKKAFREAVIRAEKAFQEEEINPETYSAIWATYVLYLTRTDADQAQKEMETAKEKLPKDQIPLVLAPCYEALGKMEEAEANYQQALKAKPKDLIVLKSVAAYYGRKGEPAKSEPLLRKILQPSLKAPPTTGSWARRTLAMVLSAQRSYPKFQEALDLIKKNKTKGELPTADRLARALILAAHPAHRSEAIRELEDLSSGASLSPGMQFRLAQLYQANGDWNKAEMQMQLLLRKSGKNPVYLRNYILLLVRNKKALLAHIEAEKLAKIAPDAFSTVACQAQALHANKQTQQAKNLLLNFATKKDAPLNFVATVLEQIELEQEAEAMYQKYIANSKDPNDVLLLASFYGRHKRLEEALAVCEKAWQTASPARVALTCLGIIRRPETTPQQQKKVQQWLLKAKNAHPEDPGLPLLYAMFFDNQGKTREAIREYEALLEKNDKNVIVLNNLAFLWSFEGEHAKAKQFINRAIELAGPVGELLDTRAVVLLQNKEAKQAIKDLETAILQKPGAIRYFHLARAHLADGNRFQAEQTLRRAINDFGLKSDNIPRVEQAAYRDLCWNLDMEAN